MKNSRGETGTFIRHQERLFVTHDGDRQDGESVELCPPRQCSENASSSRGSASPWMAMTGLIFREFPSDFPKIMSQMSHLQGKKLFSAACVEHQLWSCSKSGFSAPHWREWKCGMRAKDNKYAFCVAKIVHFAKKKLTNSPLPPIRVLTWVRWMFLDPPVPKINPRN